MLCITKSNINPVIIPECAGTEYWIRNDRRTKITHSNYRPWYVFTALSVSMHSSQVHSIIFLSDILLT